MKAPASGSGKWWGRRATLCLGLLDWNRPLEHACSAQQTFPSAWQQQGSRATQYIPAVVPADLEPPSGWGIRNLTIHGSYLQGPVNAPFLRRAGRGGGPGVRYLSCPHYRLELCDTIDLKHVSSEGGLAGQGGNSNESEGGQKHLYWVQYLPSLSRKWHEYHSSPNDHKVCFSPFGIKISTVCGFTRAVWECIPHLGFKLLWHFLWDWLCFTCVMGECDWISADSPINFPAHRSKHPTF